MIEFFKYQGTGNDFVLIDNRALSFDKNDTKLISQMCDRKFGIGADGLILLEYADSVDFHMVYYNSDGRLSTMCGNGGRCIVRFAEKLGIVKDSAVFTAVDGRHKATINKNIVSLQMNDVSEISILEDAVFLDTGSPHHVELVLNLDSFDVFGRGKSIRHNQYGSEGANVNFVEPIAADTFSVRTYERGVENETLSCGTGVTAVAIAMHATAKTSSNRINLITPGGALEVSFVAHGKQYIDVVLTGPAEMVFKGQWS